MRQLQHRVVVEALADRDRNGVAADPLLGRRVALEALGLPLFRGQHAGLFVIEVDPGRLAKAEFAHELRDVIDAHLVGQLVVIGIARVGDRMVHIDDAVAARLVIVEAVPAQHEEAGIADRILRAAEPHLERCQRHERLEGRARRIGARQRPVHQRLVERGIEFVPALGIDPVDEQVRIEPGARHIRQHVAGGRLDRHQGAALVAERFFGDLLQFDVDRQDQVTARRWRRAAQRADGAATGRALDLLVAGLAVQLALVALLDAFLAHVVGAVVVGGVVALFQRVGFLLVDAADVADHVRGHLAHRILAKQARLHFNAGKTEALRGEARHFVIGQARAQRDAGKAARLFQQALEAAPVARLDLHQLGQFVDHRFHVRLQLRWRQFERVGRIVTRQDHAVAVDDQAAVGHDRHQRDAVVLGLGRVLVVVQHLQPHDARDQEAKANEDQGDQHRQAHPELVDLAIAVFEFGHALMGRFRSIRIVRSDGCGRGRPRGAGAPAAAR